MPFKRPLGAAGALVLLLILGGCANQLRASVIDKDARPIRKAVLVVQYRDIEFTGKLDREHLSSALAKSLVDEAREVSEGRANLVHDTNPPASLQDLAQAQPDATHLIKVTASIIRHYKYYAGTWDPCAYTNKNKECQGGMVDQYSEPALARVEASVVDLHNRRVVFRIDPLESRPVPVGDQTPLAAARPIGQQLTKLLKNGGLYR